MTEPEGKPAEVFDYDAELRLHNAHFRAAARVRVHDRVLDIGCGAGQTTREAARAAADRNEWTSVIRETLTTEATVAGDGPGAFALADPAVTEGILAAAGFTDITFTDVHEPVYYGRDSVTAFVNVLRLVEFRDVIAGLGAQGAEAARGRLRALLDAHHTGDGVYFDSRAWLVTARRPPRPGV
ncbi:hypothetical protein [Nocardia sp. MW-W600-9]